MPPAKSTQPLVKGDMITTSSNLSSLAMKLLQQGKITVEQYRTITGTSDLFVTLYLDWDKQPEPAKG